MNICSWIIYINEEGKIDAKPLEEEIEKELREKGLKILGYPVFRRKSDAISYAEEVFK